MARYAIIDNDGRITNCVVWDGRTKWAPPEGHTAVNVDNLDHVGPGSTTPDNGKTFKRAPKGKPD
jgi:hypothetical protein